jgi:hypothetical protein
VGWSPPAPRRSTLHGDGDYGKKTEIASTQDAAGARITDLKVTPKSAPPGILGVAGGPPRRHLSGKVIRIKTTQVRPLGGRAASLINLEDKDRVTSVAVARIRTAFASGATMVSLTAHSGKIEWVHLPQPDSGGKMTDDAL